MEITFWVNDDDDLLGGRLVYFYYLSSVVCIFRELHESCSNVHPLGSFIFNPNFVVPVCLASDQNQSRA